MAAGQFRFYAGLPSFHASEISDCDIEQLYFYDLRAAIDACKVPVGFGKTGIGSDLASTQDGFRLGLRPGPLRNARYTRSKSGDGFSGNAQVSKASMREYSILRGE